MPDCVIHILGYSRDVPTVVGGGRVTTTRLLATTTILSGLAS